MADILSVSSLEGGFKSDSGGCNKKIDSFIVMFSYSKFQQHNTSTYSVAGPRSQLSEGEAGVATGPGR